jgi:hypothetical protein
MTKGIGELMALADLYSFAEGDTMSSRREALRAALEAALKPGGEPVAFIDRANLKELKNANGMRVWAEGPNMYFPENDCEVPTHLVAVYTTPPAQTTVGSDGVAVHMAHCNQGEWEGVCKYGACDCPALAAPPPQTCHCKDRPANECPGEWEPGCDLGNNAAHAKPYPPPRLTDEQIADAIPKVCEPKRLGEVVLDIARAIETAVRKQAGWE